MLFGGYEANAPSRWEDGAPWEHGGRALPADEERFAALMAGAVRRFPFLADAGVAGLVCHPDAMTPDANPLLGPMPGVPGFWMAAGLSLNGFGGAGGIGKAMAEWITTGETEVDVSAYRAWRFGDTYRDVDFAAWPPARRTATTTACGTRSTPTSGGGRSAPRRSTGGCRSRAPCSGRRTAGSAPTTSSPASRGAAPAPTSARSAGRRRRTSTGCARSTRHSASGPASST